MSRSSFEGPRGVPVPSGRRGSLQVEADGGASSFGSGGSPKGGSSPRGESPLAGAFHRLKLSLSRGRTPENADSIGAAARAHDALAVAAAAMTAQPDKTLVPEKLFRAGPLAKRNEVGYDGRTAVQRSWADYFVVLRGQHMIFFRDQKQVRRARAWAPASGAGGTRDGRPSGAREERSKCEPLEAWGGAWGGVVRPTDAGAGGCTNSWAHGLASARVDAWGPNPHARTLGLRGVPVPAPVAEQAAAGKPPVGAIDVLHATVAPCHDYKNRAYVFRLVVAKSASFSFQAADSADMAAWIAATKAAALGGFDENGLVAVGQSGLSVFSGLGRVREQQHPSPRLAYMERRDPFPHLCARPNPTQGRRRAGSVHQRHEQAARYRAFDAVRLSVARGRRRRHGRDRRGQRGAEPAAHGARYQRH